MVRKRGPELERVGLSIPKDLMIKVRAKLADPMRETRTKYGSLSELVSTFLVKYLNEDDITKV